MESSGLKLISNEANSLYMKILDYLIMTGDPLYNKIVLFRNAINSIKNPSDKEKLIAYFNKEFSFNNKVAWEYYKKKEFSESNYIKESKLKKIIREEIEKILSSNINEIFGLSSKEKQSNQLKKKLAELKSQFEQYNVYRLFYYSGNESNHYAGMKFRIQDLKEYMPALFELLPELFQLKQGQSNSCNAEYDGAKGVIPEKFYFVLDKNHYLNDKSKDNFINGIDSRLNSKYNINSKSMKINESMNPLEKYIYSNIKDVRECEKVIATLQLNGDIKRLVDNITERHPNLDSKILIKLASKYKIKG